MAVVTFYTDGKDQTGNTTSAMSLATYLGITKNKKTLLISTSFNDGTVRKAFWPEQERKRSGLFGPNTSVTSENGIEGLDRNLRSNRMSPEMITDYTKVALKGRLEILLGFKGKIEQYLEIQRGYAQIISLASKYYDTVIVDMDRNLEEQTKIEILNVSHIVLAMSTQKIDEITRLTEVISEDKALKKQQTVLALGKYDDSSKYNAKNITRSMLKQRTVINTIPYNTLLLEAAQEGSIIDLFLKLLRLKGRDENTFFIEEIKRLSEDLENKKVELQQLRII